MVLVYHQISCGNHFKYFLGALQGAAVTLAELGEYTRASTLLEDLAKVGLFVLFCFFFGFWIYSTLYVARGASFFIIIFNILFNRNFSC